MSQAVRGCKDAFMQTVEPVAKAVADVAVLLSTLCFPGVTLASANGSVVFWPLHLQFEALWAFRFM